MHLSFCFVKLTRKFATVRIAHGTLGLQHSFEKIKEKKKP